MNHIGHYRHFTLHPKIKNYLLKQFLYFRSFVVGSPPLSNEGRVGVVGMGSNLSSGSHSTGDMTSSTHRRGHVNVTRYREEDEDDVVVGSAVSAKETLTTSSSGSINGMTH